MANIENIGLEALGIKTEKGKIIVDANGQTNVPGIYAIGDCTPGQALAHVASKEGINAAEHLAAIIPNRWIITIYRAVLIVPRKLPA